MPSTRILVVVGISVLAAAAAMTARQWTKPRAPASTAAERPRNVDAPAPVHPGPDPKIETRIATRDPVQGPRTLVPEPKSPASPALARSTQPATGAAPRGASLSGGQPTAPPPSEPKPKRVLLDPVARDALKLVGADASAEWYWMAAINDATLSEHERSDLIEDLNEEGFADPRSPSTGEIPLILNRLDLIEQLAPHAMDQVNADAFAEAHKDLLDMLRRMRQP